MLHTKNIRFHYDTKNAFIIPDVNLARGENLLVLGHSGSGKTTFLNILGGLLEPHGGDLRLGNTELYKLKGAELDKFRGKNIGMIFQKPHILAPLTVKENLQLANYLSGAKPYDMDEILSDLNILDKKNSKISQLSEGEAQRVSIARALVNHPKLILADEPTASLDDANAERVIQLLKKQAEKLNSILIVVTHDQRVKNHFTNQMTVGKQ
ncbi:ATP-binding cassette domain-containing protein [Litoribacter ruber]|uniref:ATP-binding cassette domain-containing protein n=1 Tax=Litoribacter ruber TaxID=702568 RepID=A0AAP2CJM3_9BACT|nr:MULTISPECIES: ATP-binding cassette domain-containing protein [Litoribacter]MBS9524949.1 ATP-binding cassette domain-containing protein [Litoribacter alkaliphilus]MBT0811890.1 ATP-binding cassette domain-containing protein [Litoribacter ruber]